MPAQRKKTQDGASTEGAVSLYDALMGQIEPDLTMDRLPLLPQIYEGETSKQSRARLSHYRWAFETFTELFPTFLAKCGEIVEQAAKRALASAQIASAAHDEEALHSLEQQFQEDSQ